MTILSAEGIGFRFNSSAFELKNGSLDLSEGQILGFLGRNGACKSTLMRILLGIIRPLLGQVAYCIGVGLFAACFTVSLALLYFPDCYRSRLKTSVDSSLIQSNYRLILAS